MIQQIRSRRWQLTSTYLKRARFPNKGAYMDTLDDGGYALWWKFLGRAIQLDKRGSKWQAAAAYSIIVSDDDATASSYRQPIEFTSRVRMAELHFSDCTWE